MIKAIIFDMDGVIVDSEPVWFEVFKQVCAEYGSEYNEQHFKLMLGKANAVTTTKEIFNIKEDTNILREKILDRFISSIKKNIKVIDGFYFLFNQAKGRYIIVVASSTPIGVVEFILKELGIREGLSFVIGGDQIKKGKPDPEMFLTVAGKIDVNPEECLVIEDSPNGVKAAKAAGMKCIALKNNYVEEDELREADKIVNSLYEIDFESY